MNKDIATFAAGCFWGVEDSFRQVPGVLDVTVGYTGGLLLNPTYEDVCAGNTGHAEAVQITYDTDKVSYGQLLDIFWKNHNPTTLNRQGPDRGTQYRSAVFFHNDEQKNTASSSKSALGLNKVFADPVVTEIVPAEVFWPAEEYHQQYFAKKGIRGVCHF